MKKNRVIYTCVINGYDALKEPTYLYDNVDFVCFTDDENLKSTAWQIRTLENTQKVSPEKWQRHVKINPHIYLREYEESLYIDGNMRVTGDVFSQLDMRYDFIVPAHPYRNCIYEEAEQIIRLRRAEPVSIQNQVNFYQNQNIPKGIGLTQNGFMFRRHHIPEVRELMECWWNEVQAHTHRDQLSLPVVLWKGHSVNLQKIHPQIIMSEYIELYCHNSNKKLQIQYPKATPPSFNYPKKISVGLVYGGRLPELLFQWIDKLVLDMQAISIPYELIIINNSQTDLAWLKAKYPTIDFKIIEGIQPEKLPDGRVSGMEVAKLLATCCNMVLENASGDMIHLREDDMVPVDTCFPKMYDFLISAGEKTGAVGALYLNRHLKKYVGGKYNVNQQYEKIQRPTPSLPIKVDFTGTGCLLFWKDKSPKTFYPDLDGLACHDWRFGMDMKKLGYQMFLLPDAICRHYISCDFQFLQPPSDIELVNMIDSHSKPSNNIITKLSNDLGIRPPYKRVSVIKIRGEH